MRSLTGVVVVFLLLPGALSNTAASRTTTTGTAPLLVDMADATVLGSKDPTITFAAPPPPSTPTPLPASELESLLPLLAAKLKGEVAREMVGEFTFTLFRMDWRRPLSTSAKTDDEAPSDLPPLSTLSLPVMEVMEVIGRGWGGGEEEEDLL